MLLWLKKKKKKKRRKRKKLLFFWVEFQLSWFVKPSMEMLFRRIGLRWTLPNPKSAIWGIPLTMIKTIAPSMPGAAGLGALILRSEVLCSQLPLRSRRQHGEHWWRAPDPGLLRAVHFGLIIKTFLKKWFKVYLKPFDVGRQILRDSFSGDACGSVTAGDLQWLRACPSFLPPHSSAGGF